MTGLRRLLVTVAVLSIPRFAVAADVSIAPGAGQTTVGAVITATVQVDTNGTAVNAVEATITFPTNLLRLIAVSKTDSILALATIDSATANTTGQVHVAGGLPSPGYEGDRGTIFKVTWETLAVGQASIQVTGGKILANDGVGTNILMKQTGAIYSIVAPSLAATPAQPPVVGSLEYPNEAAWYTGTTATVYWSRPNRLEGVSFVFDREPGTIPDETIDSTDSAADVSLTDDGLWYFHLRGKYGSSWSQTVHFLLRRDATPPEDFTLAVERDRGAADPSPDIVFLTADSASGVVGYTVSVDGETAQPATSPYKIVATRSGDYQVVVTAIDKAGNIRVSATTFSVAGYLVPIITSLNSPLILLESLSVRGTALAGDRVNIFVDNRLIGSTMAGTATTAVTDGTTVRLPWTFTTDQPFGPGTHRVSATATSPSGQTSVQSDPRQVVVQGSRIQLGGQTLGTFAVVPLVGFMIVALMLAVTWLIWRLRLRLQLFEAQQTAVDEDLRILRQAVDQGRLSTQGIEEALTIIDNEVVERRPARRGKRRGKTPRPS